MNAFHSCDGTDYFHSVKEKYSYHCTHNHYDHTLTCADLV